MLKIFYYVCTYLSIVTLQNELILCTCVCSYFRILLQGNNKFYRKFAILHTKCCMYHVCTPGGIIKWYPMYYDKLELYLLTIPLYSYEILFVFVCIIDLSLSSSCDLPQSKKRKFEHSTGMYLHVLICDNHKISKSMCLLNQACCVAYTKLKLFVCEVCICHI